MAANEEAEQLAQRVLHECRVQLSLSNRYLAPALWQLSIRFESTGEGETALATDGATLFVDARRFIERYRTNPNDAVRDYVHLLLHCLLRHPFETHRVDPNAWSHACDVCVESMALELCGTRYPAPYDDKRRAQLKLIARAVGALTPGKVYRYVAEPALAPAPAAREEQPQLDPNTGLPLAPVIAAAATDRTKAVAAIMDARGLFARDGHEHWNLQAVREDDDAQGDRADEAGGVNDPQAEGDGRGGDANGPDGPGDPQAESDPKGKDGGRIGDANEDDTSHRQGGSEEQPHEARPGKRGNQRPQTGSRSSEKDAQNAREQRDKSAHDSRDRRENELADAEEAWRAIAKSVETELAAASEHFGDAPGALSANLELVNRPRLDYRDFLRRFAVPTEVMKLDPDSFDYIYYTYGLNAYGNMPLIEPLEYRESKRVRSFVVAVDTSGSCAGELVRTFLTCTTQMLKSTQQFDERVDVHVIQCDAAVQQDTHITRIDQFDEIELTHVQGLGGTDFRPVFDHVAQLQRKGELNDLRGLIYFTDGKGTFPASPPPYDTAFVFVEDEGAQVKVPPWAMRVVMTQEDIRELGHS